MLTIDWAAVITALGGLVVIVDRIQARRRKKYMVHFGTRFMVLLFIRALSEYARHKVSIDEDLSVGLKACLTELLGFVDELTGLNIPGPE